VRAALAGGAKRRALTKLPRSVQSRGKNGSYRFLGLGMAAFRDSLYFSKVCTISERAVTADDGVIYLPLSSPVSSCLHRAGRANLQTGSVRSTQSLGYGSAETLENLVKLRFGKIAATLFDLKSARISAHEDELKLSGSEIAYVKESIELLSPKR